MVKLSPLAIVATKKPPPPILPLPEEVTASANPTATAASIALPPFFKIFIPTKEASWLVETTIPFLP